MPTYQRALFLCLLLGACDPKVVGTLPLGASTDTGDEGTTGGPSTSGPVTGGELADTGTSGTSETSETSGADETTGGTSPESTGPGIEPPECAGIDHATCWATANTACTGQGNWNITQACVDAVAQCYSLGPAVLSPVDVIELCHAEPSEDCAYSNDAACGAAFCACTVGAYPFDWTNCWHLTLAACLDGAQSDCAAVVSMCYPGATEAEYDACFSQVMEDVGNDCNCPMCGIHESCETALSACLAG